MQRVTATLRGLSPWEQVGKIALVGRPFTVEADELTLTLKLRRGVIASHFSAEIEALYAAGDIDTLACELDSQAAFHSARPRRNV